MRLLCCGGLCALAGMACAFGGDRQTYLTIQNMSNTQLTVVQLEIYSGYIANTTPKAIGPSGQMVIDSQNNVPFTGCSGMIVLQPEHASGWVIIKWDNPYIGSNSYDMSGPMGWDVYGVIPNYNDNGTGNLARLTIRIDGKVALGSHKPNTPLATTGPGKVEGRVLWPTSLGSPSQPLSTRMATIPTTGGGPWRFFTMAVTQPTQFRPYAPKDSANLVYLQGQQGEYVEPKATGRVSFSALPVPVPGFDGFQFTITNLPTDVPISISVSPGANVSWPAQRPAQVRLLSGSLEPSFYCVGTDSEADLTSKMQDISGFDFTVNCEWVPSGSALHTMARPSAGGSKGVAQFGVADSSIVRAPAVRTIAPIRTRVIKP